MKKRTILIIAAVVIIAVGGFLFWRSRVNAANNAATAFRTTPVERGQLTAIVGATGTVRANQSAVLTWQGSGTVSAVKVQLDDQVTKDQVVAELDPKSLSQAVILAQADLVTAQRNLDQLRNSDVSRSQALLNLTKAQKAYDDAVTRRDSKRYRRANQNVIDTNRANFVLAQQQVKDAEDIFSANSTRSDDDVAYAQALSLLASARQNRDRAEANLNYVLGLPDAQEIAEADANVRLTKAQLDDAQREWERLKDGPTEDDINAASARVAALDATINLARVSSPISGSVSQVSAKVGDTVTPGTVCVRVDDLSHLLVDVEIPEIDINSIQTGQPATFSFDAVQGKTYNGKVSEVSRVGTPVQGVVNFTVTIELTDPDESVRPGMTAAVNLIVKQLSDVLLVPNRAVRLRDGQRIVYVLRNNVPTPVDIEIGATSDTNSEIISGELKEGDPIVLNPPTEFQPGPPMRGQ